MPTGSLTGLKMRFPKTRTSGSYASIARNPAIWVGLPSQRGPKATVDSPYLNELYRSRAERAGIIYVDVWDGFVDEAGKFSPQGPDYQGQIRRLRTSAPLARDAAVLEAGSDLQLSAQAKVGISYAGQLAHSAHDHSVKGNFTWRF